MGAIHLYGRELESLFQLLGEHENDMTRCHGWCLARSSVLGRRLLASIGTESDSSPNLLTRLQETTPENGITDVEIEVPNEVFVIMEAKRGWVLPSAAQLEMYSRRPRFLESGAASKKLVVISECTDDYAYRFLPLRTDSGFEVRNLPWREVLGLVARPNGNREGLRGSF
jgi:hypothetical protein